MCELLYKHSANSFLLFRALTSVYSHIILIIQTFSFGLILASKQTSSMVKGRGVTHPKQHTLAGNSLGENFTSLIGSPAF